MDKPDVKIPIAKYFGLYLCLAGFALSMTVLYLAMRAVMEVGGFCAEGGAYEIAVHCPTGVAWKTPLSIFGLFGFGLGYFLNIVPGQINLGYLFWSILFGALGWNFIDFGIWQTDELVVSWLVCGIIFWLMGVGPLWLLANKETGRLILTNWISLVFQVFATVMGITGGMFIFNL